jgi:tRNA (guanine-N7-)-methyltransferase
MVETPEFSVSFDFLPTDAPVEVDLGCHRGLFVVEMAARYPERFFLGVERQRHRVERCQAKIVRLGLANAHVVQGEGRETLLAMPEASVDAVHVSFPDPWPKRRHHSRRLVNRALLEASRRVLCESGSLRLMTDDEPYFLAMREAAEGFDGFRPIPWDDGRLYPETEFQKKFAAIAKPIHRLALRRCDSMSSA